MKLLNSSTLVGLVVSTVAGAALVIGCQPTGDTPDAALIAEQRDRLMLADEPEGAVTATNLREQEAGFESGPVVLVGQVGGMPNPWADTEKNFPWVAGEATFFLVDPAVVAEFADHASDDPDHAANCPFCARAAANSVDAIATVTFNDEQGEPIPVEARKLFKSLKSGDMVVVRGEGRLLANSLVVEADGLYLRR